MKKPLTTRATASQTVTEMDLRVEKAMSPGTPRTRLHPRPLASYTGRTGESDLWFNKLNNSLGRWPVDEELTVQCRRCGDFFGLEMVNGRPLNSRTTVKGQLIFHTVCDAPLRLFGRRPEHSRRFATDANPSGGVR